MVRHNRLNLQLGEKMLVNVPKSVAPSIHHSDTQ
jgi:hypothetical protein